MSPANHLEIIPLGGVGEFGMNLMVYRHGRDCVVVDAGMMFPGEEHLGVDVVIPNLTFLEDCGTIHGVILTHAHEDHIGALPHLLARFDVPVYVSSHAREVLRERLARMPDLDPENLRSIPDGDGSLRLGPFSVETVHAAHSIPQSRMLVLRTPVGTVLHTADFKLDPSPPHERPTDLARLAALGQEGVLALLSDSTNADRPGFTPGERTVAAGIDRILAGSQRRVVVTTFASNVGRVQQLIDLAVRHHRNFALVGTSLQAHADIAQRLGHLRIPPGSRSSASELMQAPPESGLLVATGSQGEPLSALARIAVGSHREVELGPGDLVIHSARKIPGNEKSIGRMINHLMRRGVDVITADEQPVHCSGHPSQEELRLLLQLVRPRFLIPIHGEYRQLRSHARLAVDAGMEMTRVLLAESGDCIALDENAVRIVDRVPVGHVFIDATYDEVDRDLLRDRRRSADGGIVVPVVTVDREHGTVNGDPEIITRGFVAGSPGANDDAEVILEAKRILLRTVQDATAEERLDEAMLRARIQKDLRRFLKRRTQRRPLIIPVIVEL